MAMARKNLDIECVIWNASTYRFVRLDHIYSISVFVWLNRSN